MRVIGIIGRSGSGKTTTIEKLIGCFTEKGFSVGTLKDLKKADYRRDTEGKNTDRHKKAGAEPVTARGEFNTDIMFTHKLEVPELLRHYDNDIVLLEGFRDFCVPQILTGCDEEQLKEKYTPNVIAVSGIYANEHKIWNHLPVYNAISDTEAFCDFILEQTSPLESLLPDLYYGGKKLPLSYAAKEEIYSLLQKTRQNISGTEDEKLYNKEKIMLEYKRKESKNEN